MLQCQFQELQFQAKEVWASISRVTKLEAKLKETMVRGGEMFVQGQDSIKKELAKHFSVEEFSWIDDMFLNEKDEDKDGQDKERIIEDNPPDPASIVIEIPEPITEAREEATDDVPPTL